MNTATPPKRSHPTTILNMSDLRAMHELLPCESAVVEGLYELFRLSHITDAHIEVITTVLAAYGMFPPTEDLQRWLERYSRRTEGVLETSRERLSPVDEALSD
jgi:hypothetical protein